MASQIQQTIGDDIKASMRAKDKVRLATLRSIAAAFKQSEVDTRKELSDEDVIAILDKLAKQRRESIEQFAKGGRDDLVTNESAELEIIQSYLPEPLDMLAIDNLIMKAIETLDASSIKDMGKVMALLKPQVQGRADLAQVSLKVKEKLGA